MWGGALMKVIIISMVIDIKGAEWVNPWKLTYDVDGPLSAEVGSSLIINCSYSYDPANDIHGAVFIPDSVSWYKCERGEAHCLPSDVILRSNNVDAGQDESKGRVSLLETNITQWNASIVIRDLRVSDTGTYQFKAKGQLDGMPGYQYSFSDKKLIKVTGLAQPIISGGPTVVGVGDNLTMTCEAPSAPPSTVTWHKVGSPIPLQTGTQRANLSIPNATRDDSGHYTCTANHLTKTLSAFVDVNVVEKCPAPPIITGLTTIQQGDMLNLTCQAQSSLSIVTWTKAGSHIPLETGTGVATLVIPNATRDHSGRYSCTADTETLSAFADVSVIEKCPAPPIITGLTTIEQGDALNLTCQAQSSLSIVTWTKAGSHIPLETGTGVATLVILNATRDHSGRYSCTEKHLTKTLSAFADVSVIEKCPAPPIITGLTTIQQGDMLNLTCQAQSSLSTVTWTKAGSHIPLETGTGVATLVIPNATRDHSGRYSCTEKHLTKTLSAFADISVTEKCPIPEEEGLFKMTTVLTYVIMTAVLGVLVLISFGLAKIFRRRTEKTYQAVAVEMVTQTGGRQGVDGVDGPEDTQPKALEGVGERGQEGEVPDPATTPV